MVRLHISALVAVFAAATAVYADGAIKCGANNNCPADTPCCSQYGECGVGAYCLGGCDPLFSHSLDSCAPAPVCRSSDYKFKDLSQVQANTKYLGDSSKANWVSSGEPVVYSDQVLLTMPQSSVGTLLASTAYVWYGKVSATLKTSGGAGVVTAFILLSDVKDEIDFEFVGTDTTHAQSNYYFQGITDYDNELNITVDSDTFQNYHTYEIDWTPDQITWSIDGVVGRTKSRNTTWNSTRNQYDYPQTPARVQLSLWPAGLPSNGAGTVAWAGGQIQWSSPYMTNGYYYAMVSDVNVECYDPPQGANVTGSKSYIFNSAAGTNDTVATVNDPTILSSFEATGENPKLGASSSSASSGAKKSGKKTGSSAAASSSAAAPQVPGLSGGRPGDNSAQSASASSESSASSATGASTAATAKSTAGSNGFSQGGSSSSSNSKGSGASPVKSERILQGSLFAGLIAIVGAIAL
ncbi:MAG: hypothetical protein M1819_006582 [Sarea resinae]|nr:MAG: hypothetical protein M1819_006582 [Sarea resinae]